MAGETFWSSPNAEAKRKYKFVARWSNSGLPYFVIAKVDLPKLDIAEAEVNSLNHTFYYPGRVKWNDVQMEIVDSESINCCKIIMQKFVESGYGFPTTPNQYRTISKAGAVKALGTLEIQEISWDATILGTWKFTNAWIKTFDAGGMDYSSDEIQKINLTIKYDFANYDTENAGEFLPDQVGVIS